MQEYVLGFAFDNNLRVALVKKNRPDWMAGKWNGIGGKIEPNESAIAAMVREFNEETGLLTTDQTWQHFATLRDQKLGYLVVCFITILKPETLDLVRTTETEEIRVFTQVLDDPDVDLMPNLRWLIPMSLTLGENDIPVLVDYGVG